MMKEEWIDDRKKIRLTLSMNEADIIRYALGQSTLKQEWEEGISPKSMTTVENSPVYKMYSQLCSFVEKMPDECKEEK